MLSQLKLALKATERSTMVTDAGAGALPRRIAFKHPVSVP